MENKLMVLPNCPVHGQTTLRPKERQSYEQQWCGVWYDCSQCGYSVLYPSKELWEYLEGQLYRYRLISTGCSSARYGNCEICGEHCAEIFHQVEERQYKPGRFTRHQCSDLWGHKECLKSSRRKNNEN
jgi:hypothetical protein